MFRYIKLRVLVFSIVCLISTVLSQEPSMGNVRGSVTDSDGGAEIAGAMVILNSGIIRGTALDTAITDAGGNFNFEFLVERNNVRVSLFVTKDGYRPANETGIRLEGNDSVVVPVEMVKTDIPVDTADVTSTGTIQGTVFADSLSGEPIARARVILSSSGGILGTQIATALTNASGNYVFTEIKADGRTRYSINASAPGFAPESVTRITLDSGEVDTTHIVLMTMGEGSWLVMGTVVKDSAGGDPLPGALVELTAFSGQETRYSGLSDGSGNFQILIPARVLSYSLTAMLDGFVQSVTNDLMVSDDSTLSSDIVMQLDTNAAAVGYPGIAAESRIIVRYVSTSQTLRVDLSTELLRSERDAELKIYDVQGKPIRIFQGMDLSQNTDVAGIAGGLYFWTFKSKRNTAAGKFQVY